MATRVVAVIVVVGGLVAAACGDGSEPSGGPAPDEGKKVVMAAAGDIGLEGDGVATLEAVAEAKPAVFLVLGDLSYAGPDSEQGWCRLVAERLEGTPVQLVAGNHEDDNGKDGSIGEFAACLPDRMRSTGRYGSEYHFDVEGLARVIMISPDLTIGGEHFDYDEGNERVRWLERAIDEARSARLPWVVVGMHKNCLTVGNYRCSVDEELLHVLTAKKVDLVLHAHDHSYQRSHQLALGEGCLRVEPDSFERRCVADDGSDGTYPKGKGPVFVVSGAGGSNLYEMKPQDPEAGYFVTWMGANVKPRKGFLRLTVTRERLEGEFVGTTDTSDYSDRFAVVGVPGPSGRR
ncbi:MAG: metallophosphoesterase [Actinomycetota bacterium]|nr:metallophosphoesterase [Actinomycetota bacterium]